MFPLLETLRALYIGDNDFEMLPGDVENLINLQILVLRDNDLLTVPRELGRLSKLKELHIQGILEKKIEKREGIQEIAW